MSKRLHFFGSRFRLFNFTSSIFCYTFYVKKMVRSNITNLEVPTKSEKDRCRCSTRKMPTEGQKSFRKKTMDEWKDGLVVEKAKS